MMRREERNIYREYVCVCWGCWGYLSVLWPHDYMYLSKLIEMYSKKNLLNVNYTLKVPANFNCYISLIATVSPRMFRNVSLNARRRGGGGGGGGKYRNY